MSTLDKIDTRQGTRNQHNMGHGNTLPYTGFPFGMNHFVMVTRLDDVRFFHPEDYQTFGIRLTHQPSPWMGDFFYATFQYLQVNEEEYDRLKNNLSSEVGLNQLTSYFRPDEAKFHPHYLSYKTLRNEIQHEWTVSQWGARYQGTTRKPKFRQLFALLIDAKASVEVDEKTGRMQYITSQRAGSKYDKGQQYGQIDIGTSVKLLRQDRVRLLDREQVLYFYELSDLETIRSFSLTTSYLSFNQVRDNREEEKEFYQGAFDCGLAYSHNAWMDYLNRIEVESRYSEQIDTFYHCLYRTATFPQAAYEIQNGQPVHFSFYTGKQELGYAYTNNGYWDTFRTSYPLYSLIAPEMVSRFIAGIAAIAKEDGYLPKWLSPDERGLMPGTLVDGVIADAIIKGFVDKPMAEFLLDAMIYTATHEGNHETEGREGVEAYEKLGYLPSEYHESVNKTLDFAYSDFCISQVASYLGKKELAAQYAHKARNYQNLFDRQTGLMRPKASDGTWVEIQSSDRWGQHYTEGSAWQNSWFVPHNIGDLVSLHGGDAVFSKRLEQLINQEPTYDVNGYGYEIHEMAEMAMLDFGQLALSNQPSFHLPYLYIYAGYPHLSHLLLKQLMATCFHPRVDGFVGDEDNGSMSAWYVLSSLGLYCMTPGSGEWTLGISIWDRVSIRVEGGVSLEIINQIKPKAYLNVVISRECDEQIYQAHSIGHKDLLKTKKIEQTLGVIPSMESVDQAYRPYSMDGYPV